MASVERVEKSIQKVERFRVSILYSTPARPRVAMFAAIGRT